MTTEKRRDITRLLLLGFLSESRTVVTVHDTRGSLLIKAVKSSKEKGNKQRENGSSVKDRTG